jgi:hypothetical protein
MNAINIMNEDEDKIEILKNIRKTKKSEKKGNKEEGKDTPDGEGGDT